MEQSVAGKQRSRTLPGPPYPARRGSGNPQLKRLRLHARAPTGAGTQRRPLSQATLSVGPPDQGSDTAWSAQRTTFGDMTRKV